MTRCTVPNCLPQPDRFSEAVFTMQTKRMLLALVAASLVLAAFGQVGALIIYAFAGSPQTA